MYGIKLGAILLSSVLLLAVTGCESKMSSESSTKSVAPTETLPPVVLDKAKEEVPGGEIVDINSRGDLGGGVTYEIKVVSEQEAHDLQLSETGEIQSHDVKTVLEMPDAVAAAVEERFPDGKVYNVAKDTEAGRETIQVDLFDNGNRYELEFTADGELIEQSPQP